MALIYQGWMSWGCPVSPISKCMTSPVGCWISLGLILRISHICMNELWSRLLYCPILLIMRHLITFIPLLMSFRASSKNGVAMVLTPDIVLIDPDQVPTGCGDPSFSISALLTKFNTELVSRSALVSMVCFEGRCNLILLTHWICVFWLCGEWSDENAFNMSSPLSPT